MQIHFKIRQQGNSKAYDILQKRRVGYFSELYCNDSNSEKREYLAKEKGLYVFYNRPWDDGITTGYYLQRERTEECDGYMICDYDILTELNAECIDEDIIHTIFDMWHDEGII